MLSPREEREARRKSPSEAQIFYVTKESIQEPAEVSEMATLVLGSFSTLESVHSMAGKSFA